MTKPILIHGHAGGPNPWKVVLLLEELKVPYELKYWQFPDLKKSEYEKLNINGRTPTIEDPNTGLTLWESGAILEYLIETYDKSHTFAYTSSPEKFYLQQWLHFQMSGQGPYFGQKVWFTYYHPEKLPSAIERYAKEIDRVISVIDRHLKASGGEYLVGDKYTYADLAFIPWFAHTPTALDNKGVEKEWETKFPNFSAWWQRIKNRPVTVKALKQREEAMAKAH
ncbi:glutathione S-transferase [Myriangium duriaei CBS 260.36]|uniref:glutathione transferase n=1 Tax=Myriangium duriaei CBS 260.36 TaxID=1168546 RepID=A0A9P4J2P1_9PEZI|nr:glutathione S-transferase [Myriangium duriaei CBS 260.36]